MLPRDFSTADSTCEPLISALIRKERDGKPGGAVATVAAEGAGWRVLDIVCTAGPRDRPFEERHAWVSMSLVRSGAFTYRSDRGSSLMSSGSILLGSIGRGFECSHRHGAGDRCLSFQYDPQLFENISRDAGRRRAGFDHDRLPPLRELASLTARANAALDRRASFEEIALEFAGAVAVVDSACAASPDPYADDALVVRVLRHLESGLDQPHTVADLASIAGLSRYHFLRTFRRATGVTPHQWILRARLREAARRLIVDRVPITDLALEVGFQDLSNFIHGFRAEFGISPRGFRAALA